MTTLTDLHQTVQDTIAAKRLGTPVFVRYQFYSNDKPNILYTRLSRMITAIGQWMDQNLFRMYALGGNKDRHITLTLEFARGASALLTWANSQAKSDGVDVMLIGNQGVLYHDAGLGILWDEPAEALGGASNKGIVNLIQKALRTSGPVSAGGN